jgi:hypothetical protein
VTQHRSCLPDEGGGWWLSVDLLGIGRPSELFHGVIDTNFCPVVAVSVSKNDPRVRSMYLVLPDGWSGEGLMIHDIRVQMKLGTEYLSTWVQIIANCMVQPISLLIGSSDIVGIHSIAGKESRSGELCGFESGQLKCGGATVPGHPTDKKVELQV